MENWFNQPENKTHFTRHLAIPFDNIWISSDPYGDGTTQEIAKSFQAIINVNDTPSELFYPAFPEQRIYWYPINELGYWGYAPFFWFKRIMDHHHAKNDKILVHCAAGAFRSPTMVFFWLKSLGFTEPKINQIMQYTSHPCWKDSIPKCIDEFYRRMHDNPQTYCLASMFLEGGKGKKTVELEFSREVLGRRYWRILAIHYLWFYYRPKYWLKRKLEKISEYIKGNKWVDTSYGYEITPRNDWLAKAARKIARLLNPKYYAMLDRLSEKIKKENNERK